jgi:hypothetical protein
LRRNDRQNQNDRWRGSQQDVNQRRQREQAQHQQRAQEYNRRWSDQQRFWAQRERQLQQQRRLARWRFEQRYWEGLRLDQQRLNSFSYVDYGVPNYRYYRGGNYYEVNQYGANLLRQAVNNGYQEGLLAGQADREDSWNGNYQDSDAYQDGSYGYDGYYVDLAEYQYYFRQGFERGYQDGYYGRSEYGTYSNGSASILGDVLNLILDIRDNR